jgi:hypothetical protein
MATNNPEKVYENRLRRMASRQGLQLVKSRRRDYLATDYGMWWIVDPNTNTIVTSEYGMSLEGVAAYLKDE